MKILSILSTVLPVATLVAVAVAAEGAQDHSLRTHPHAVLHTTAVESQERGLRTIAHASVRRTNHVTRPNADATGKINGFATASSGAKSSPTYTLTAQVKNHLDGAPTLTTTCASGYVALPSVYTSQSCSQAPTTHNTLGSEMHCGDVTISRGTATCVTTAPVCTSGEITHPPTYTTSKCADDAAHQQSCSTWVESFTFEYGITPCIPSPTMHTRSIRSVAIEARATATSISGSHSVKCGILFPCPGETTDALGGFFHSVLNATGTAYAPVPTLTDRIITLSNHTMTAIADNTTNTGAPVPSLTDRIITVSDSVITVTVTVPCESSVPTLTDTIITPTDRVLTLTDRIITITTNTTITESPAPTSTDGVMSIPCGERDPCPGSSTLIEGNSGVFTTMKTIRKN